jgi:hypothetical protein
MSVDFSISAIPAVAGAILSLFFSYIPGIESWYANLETTSKRLVMLVLVILVSAGIYGLGCAGLITTSVTCDKGGLMQAVNIFFSVLVANQSAYLISKS